MPADSITKKNQHPKKAYTEENHLHRKKVAKPIKEKPLLIRSMVMLRRIFSTTLSFRLRFSLGSTADRATAGTSRNSGHAANEARAGNRPRKSNSSRHLQTNMLDPEARKNPEGQSRNTGPRDAVIKIVQGLVTIALLWWLLHDPTRACTWLRQKHANVWWLLAAIVAAGACELFGIIRWQLFLKMLHLHIPLTETTRLFFVGAFFKSDSFPARPAGIALEDSITHAGTPGTPHWQGF
jgi:hypothetical protein